MLSALATRWRDFKTFLTREYVFGERQNETPCLKYQITDEEWMQFRATRLDPSWQAKRIAAQERQAKNDAPHLLSRGGYERKKKEMKKARAEAAGVESADRVESPPRHEMWIAARTKSDGQITSEFARVVADKIRLVAIGRVFGGGSTIHGVPLQPDWTRDVVDQVQDAAAPVPLPNSEIQLVGQATGTFLAWPKCLVMQLSARAKVIILLLFYIVIILLLYMDKLSVDQAQVYGFIESQPIQKSGNTQVQIQQYMQTWMSDSQRDIYMAPYIDGSHWQLMVIIPKEYTVVWFCSLHRKPSHEIKCQLQG
uniref:DUF8039 domain-containing protein n=1 Tax=Cajanus cajan TaxID=3821 RepID=A0A151S793_CAJCA|nr:hypothetical protein KK1_027575 [Cajanus cajan]